MSGAGGAHVHGKLFVRRLQPFNHKRAALAYTRRTLNDQAQSYVSTLSNAGARLIGAISYASGAGTVNEGDCRTVPSLH